MERIRFIVTFLAILYINNINGNRITGVTSIKNHPYQLQVKYTNYHRGLCGATLLRPMMSLTCANCVAERHPLEMSVGAGSSDFTKGDGIWRRVLVILMHPLYQLGFSDYNMAILITGPFPLSINIQPIDLLPREYKIHPNTLGNVTGYGILNWLVPGNALRYATLSRLRDDNCYKIFKDQFTDRMFCFIDKAQNQSYLSDMGDPLIINNTLAGLGVSTHYIWGVGKPVMYLSVQNPAIRFFIIRVVEEFNLKTIFPD